MTRFKHVKLNFNLHQIRTNGCIKRKWVDITKSITLGFKTSAAPAPGCLPPPTQSMAYDAEQPPNPSKPDQEVVLLLSEHNQYKSKVAEWGDMRFLLFEIFPEVSFLSRRCVSRKRELKMLLSHGSRLEQLEFMKQL